MYDHQLTENSAKLHPLFMFLPLALVVDETTRNLPPTLAAGLLQFASRPRPRPS